MTDEKPYPKLAALREEAAAMITRHRDEECELRRRHREEWDELQGRVTAEQEACPHDRTRDLGYEYPQGSRSRCLDCGAERWASGWWPRPEAVRTI